LPTGNIVDFFDTEFREHGVVVSPLDGEAATETSDDTTEVAGGVNEEVDENAVEEADDEVDEQVGEEPNASDAAEETIDSVEEPTEAANENRLINPRRKRSNGRSHDSSIPLLEQIGVERVTDCTKSEMTRLRKCAAGKGNHKGGAAIASRAETLPENLQEALASGDLVLLKCKHNSAVDGGGQPGVDFRSLRTVVYTRCATWRNEFNDADFYEYSISGSRRYLLSGRAFRELKAEAEKTSFEAIKAMRNKDNCRKAIELLYGIKRDDVTEEICDSFRDTVDAMICAIEPEADEETMPRLRKATERFQGLVEHVEPHLLSDIDASTLTLGDRPHTRASANAAGNSIG